MYTAADVMTDNVITVTPDISIKQVVKILYEKKISGVPVVDSNGGMVGVITETDLMGKQQEDLKVNDIMTKSVISVDIDTPIEEISKILIDKVIRRVPVTQDGKLVGVVSRGDLMKPYLW